MKLNLKARLDRLLLNIFYVGLVTVSILFLAEIGAGTYLLAKTKQISPAGPDSVAYSYFDWSEQYFKDRRKVVGQFKYEPFTVWKNADRESDLINVRNGYRVTWEPEKDPDKKDFLIFMFGGSTTFCIESPDHLTIASLLAKKLNQQSSEYRFVVRNYGVSAFVSDQEVHLLTKLLVKGERPDAVIFYDGLNDIQIKVGLGREHFFENSFQRQLFAKTNWRTRLQRLANKSRLVALITDRPSPQQALFPFITEQEKLRQNAESMLAEYQENVRVVKALGEKYGFSSIHFWQPSLFNSHKKLTSDEMLRASSYADLYQANQLSHGVVAKAIEDARFFKRAGVVDIGHTFDEIQETIFVDSNHVTPIGNKAVADTIHERISGEVFQL